MVQRTHYITGNNRPIMKLIIFINKKQDGNYFSAGFFISSDMLCC